MEFDHVLNDCLAFPDTQLSGSEAEWIEFATCTLACGREGRQVEGIPRPRSTSHFIFATLLPSAAGHGYATAFVTTVVIDN
jgi:hypothetical protein